MKFGMVGPTYTSRSPAVGNEECINLYAESFESQPTQTVANLYWTPGTAVFSNLVNFPVRGSAWTGTRCFFVGGTELYELDSAGGLTDRGTVFSDGFPVSIALSTTQMLIVSSRPGLEGKAYCYTFATNVLLEITGSLIDVPTQVVYSDGYFIVSFKNSNKFQISALLDGTTWPGINVNEVSVFPENIRSIIVIRRELWVFGVKHSQPYYDSGSLEIFDVISGALIEKGCASTFTPCLLDNTLFWIDEDERGARVAWRAEGYTPVRVSTHAVEYAWSKYSLDDFNHAVTYSYQDAGHLFWVLYVPNTDCSWVYDVSNRLWHKRAFWNNGAFEPHHSWNHVYAFGKNLVGDWKSANIYELSEDYVDDAGSMIRRVRRSPTIANEMQWIQHSSLVVDFETGLGPQPPLVDGNGNPRPPQAILRWSDDRGRTWSNEHVANCGLAGEYKTRVVYRRLGRSRYRVYELSMTDPIKWTVIDAYLNPGASDGS